jgi:hypothetical protein
MEVVVEVGGGGGGEIVDVEGGGGGGAVVVEGLDSCDVEGGGPPLGGVMVGLIGTVPSDGVALQVLT